MMTHNANPVDQQFLDVRELLLQQTDVRYIQVEYEGSDYKRTIESIGFFKDADCQHRALMTVTDQDYYTKFIYQVLAAYCGDWAAFYGSYGTMVIDLKNMQFNIDHYQRQIRELHFLKEGRILNGTFHSMVPKPKDNA